jgi:hypothetical protein
MHHYRRLQLASIIGLLVVLSACLDERSGGADLTTPSHEMTRSLLAGADEVAEGLTVSGVVSVTFEVLDPALGDPAWRRVQQHSSDFTGTVVRGQARIALGPPDDDRHPAGADRALHPVVVAQEEVAENPANRRVRVRRSDGTEALTIFTAARKGEPVARTKHYEGGQLQYEIHHNWKQVVRGWVLTEVAHSTYIDGKMVARATQRYRINQSARGGAEPPGQVNQNATPSGPGNPGPFANAASSTFESFECDDARRRQQRAVEAMVYWSERYNTLHAGRAALINSRTHVTDPATLQWIDLQIAEYTEGITYTLNMLYWAQWEHGQASQDVSFYCTRYVDNPGGGGGSDGGGTGNCTTEFVIIEVFNETTGNWDVWWSGYATVCG